MPKTELGLRLRYIMLRQNLTVAQLAAYLGSPEATIQKWITGTRCPGAATFRLLDVLYMVERDAPKVHRRLMDHLPERRGAGRPRRA